MNYVLRTYAKDSEPAAAPVSLVQQAVFRETGYFPCSKKFKNSCYWICLGLHQHLIKCSWFLYLELN